MRPEDLKFLYNYNHWANQRILDHTARLTPEQLHAPEGGSYGSVHATLVHTMEAEATWLMIWRGEGIDLDWSPYELDPADFPDVAAIRAMWNDVAADLSEFVDGLTPKGENSPDQIISWSGDAGALRRRRLWPLMVHVVNHGTQHRSEVAMALTRYGHSPSEIDVTQYLRETYPEEGEG